MKLTASRNQREGRYQIPLNPEPGSPQYQWFHRERKRGRNSRRITAQFFNNGERYNSHNPTPAIKAYP